MLLVITSPTAVLRGGIPDPQIVQVLINAQRAGNPVGIISNHTKPSWFDTHFGDSGVQFFTRLGRQNGVFVSRSEQHFGLQPFDALVLASKDEDIQMGKNGGAVIVAAGWSSAEQVRKLGIRVDNARQLQEVINLTSLWGGQWWYQGDTAKYKVRALANLSGYSQPIDQQVLARKLTDTVKNGGSRLNALLTVTARSLLMDGVGAQDNLLWGVYPSSDSDNDDTEILSDFTHRLRTTVSRVRFAKKGEPLFIRHTPSIKRSTQGGVRTDPENQIITTHLNPFYYQKGRLIGRHVIVIDDCTTYGVSFGVAAALLYKAGAASVVGVALGKFGDQLRSFDIEIHTNPFAPIPMGGYSHITPRWLREETSASTQQTLQTLIP
jgi:hypothetical protein